MAVRQCYLSMSCLRRQCTTGMGHHPPRSTHPHTLEWLADVRPTSHWVSSFELLGSGHFRNGSRFSNHMTDAYTSLASEIMLGLGIGLWRGLGGSFWPEAVQNNTVFKSAQNCVIVSDGHAWSVAVWSTVRSETTKLLGPYLVVLEHGKTARSPSAAQ